MEHFITHKIQAKVKNLLQILYLELSSLIDVKKSHFVHDFDLFNFCPPHNTLWSVSISAYQLTARIARAELVA